MGKWSVDSLIGMLVFLLIFAAVVGLIFTGLDDAANATGADASFAQMNTVTKLLIGLIPLGLVLGGGILGGRAYARRRRRR